MANVSTYGDINQRTAAYAAVEMLKHAEPILVLSRWAQLKPVPKNKAQTVKFRRAVPFTVSTVPLVEGVTPTGQKISYTDVTAQLQQYGDIATITDVVQDVAEDPVLKNGAQLMGELAAETIEMVCYGIIKAGTTIYYGAAADTARSDVNDPITADRQEAVVRGLNAQRAKRVTSIQAGSVKVGTVPIEASFGAFCSTDIDRDLRQITGFRTPNEYGSGGAVSDYEMGSFRSCRYITSPLLTAFADSGSATLNNMVSTGGSNVDVYPIIYVSRDSYGSVMLQGRTALQPIVINPGNPSAADPLGQKGFIGFKTWYAAIVLNHAWLARLEVGATDL